MSSISIPCLSLWQIWAEAMRQGIKKVETRDDNQISWTKYRGDIAIHAAKLKWNSDPIKWGYGLIEQVKLDRLDVDIVYGAVLCIVELVDIKNTEEVWDSISYIERMYGNYADGRKALMTRNLRLLPKPVPLKGHQGWFPWVVPKEYEHLVNINNPGLGL